MLDAERGKRRSLSRNRWAEGRWPRSGLGWTRSPTENLSLRAQELGAKIPSFPSGFPPWMLPRPIASDLRKVTGTCSALLCTCSVPALWANPGFFSGKIWCWLCHFRPHLRSGDSPVPKTPDQFLLLAKVKDLETRPVALHPQRPANAWNARSLVSRKADSSVGATRLPSR